MVSISHIFYHLEVYVLQTRHNLKAIGHHSLSCIWMARSVLGLVTEEQLICMVLHIWTQPILQNGIHNHVDHIVWSRYLYPAHQTVS
jgi:hypothetical protein